MFIALDKLNKQGIKQAIIAEPDASEDMVTNAVNDTLKAISASLLMEQVLAPRFNFTPKNVAGGPKPRVRKRRRPKRLLMRSTMLLFYWPG